jgi:transcriptional regulator with XRE-family HTH domain
MAKQDPRTTVVPSLIVERLQTWGMCVRKQRIAQRIRASDLCARLGISHPTLQRLQRGEASVGAGVYLAALQILGVFDDAAPMLRADLWRMDQANGRARPDAEGDDEYF